MPRGDWRAYGEAARAGVVAVALLSGASPLSARPDGNPSQHRTETAVGGNRDTRDTDRKSDKQASPPRDFAGAPQKGSTGEPPTKQNNEGGPKWTDVIVAVSALGTLLLTGVLAWSTVRLWIETKRLAEGAKTQELDFKRSIEEATRSAGAMEEVAEAMARSAELTEQLSDRQRVFGEIQMRAYLSVLIGGAVYQERKKGLRFEAIPVLLNTGSTPAKRVRWRAKAAILPNPLPPDFKFPLPPEKAGSNLLTAQQSGKIPLLVDGFVPDREVSRIKQGATSALYAWGVVSYVDIFGRRHRVTFAHQIRWLGTKPNEVVDGWYMSKHNSAN